MTDDRKDVFAEQPDDRQLQSPVIPDECLLFRKRYRQLTPLEIDLHDRIKDKADELAALIACIKAGESNPPLPDHVANGGPVTHTLANIANNQKANVTLALRHLEDAVYRAVKALTA